MSPGAARVARALSGGRPPTSGSVWWRSIQFRHRRDGIHTVELYLVLPGHLLRQLLSQNLRMFLFPQTVEQIG